MTIIAATEKGKTMNKEIKKATNYLIALLDNCWDGDLVDEVCMRVSSNDPFEEIDDE